MPIRVVQYGLGAIGCVCAREVLNKDGLRLVGAIDVDPAKTGRDLGEVLRSREKLGIRVSSDATALLPRVKPNVVLHTTRSIFRDVYPQLADVARAGVNLVSSTEELLYPALGNPELAAKLNRIALRNKVTLLGTGVNPGFVMDTLALVLSGVSRTVRSIKVQRRVDAATRRGPLQRKVGAGMNPQEFRRLVKQGKLGHKGLAESLALVAAGIGWKLDRVREKIDPVLADKAYRTRHLRVSRGDVCGIKHTAVGFSGRKRVVDLDLRMYVGARDPMDAVTIEGDPPLRLQIPGGVAGDVATVASLINAIPRVVEAEPGLKTMLDLPIPRAFRAT